MSLRLTRGARNDVADVVAWYQDKGSGVAADFLRALEATLAAIERNPLGYARVHGEARRVVLRRFPYCVFYYIDNDDVVVIGCLHGRRDPQVWQSRSQPSL